MEDQRAPARGGGVSSPASHALVSQTFWDETPQPPSRPSLTSGEATSRRRSLPSQPKTFSGTRRPSPYPKTQPPRGWRRPVSSLPRPRKPNFLGRDVPAPTRSTNYFGVGDVPSPHFPRPRMPNFLGRDVPAPIQRLNHLGAGDVPSPASHALVSQTFWDETPQPPSRPSLTSGEATSRRRSLPSQPKTFSGTRRPSPYPKTQPPRGWRRPVSSLPRPRKPNFLGRDVPAPTRSTNYFGVGDVPSPHFPRPRMPNFLGRDVPAPTRSINYFGVGDVSPPHLPRLRNQHPLGRDVPAPIPTLTYFGGGDVSSP